MGGQSGSLDLLVERVVASPKYAHIYRDLIYWIGERELARQHGLKEAIKATKDKLHQVGGAYLERRPDYAAWQNALAQAAAAGGGDLRQACAKVMAEHASSHERLPILERFYSTLLGALPPVHSVLDVACGLNPLAIPWMPLAEGAEYHACDMYHDMIAFIAEFLALASVPGSAVVCDAIRQVPDRRADLALLLKTVPCLDQMDRSAAPRLLEAIDAPHLIISFPVRSLGGARKGMGRTYEQRLEELVAGRPWAITRFSFPGELAFLVRK